MYKDLGVLSLHQTSSSRSTTQRRDGQGCSSAKRSLDCDFKRASSSFLEQSVLTCHSDEGDQQGENAEKLLTAAQDDAELNNDKLAKTRGSENLKTSLEPQRALSEPPNTPAPTSSTHGKTAPTAPAKMQGVYCGNRPMRISTAIPENRSGSGGPGGMGSCINRNFKEETVVEEEAPGRPWATLECCIAAIHQEC